MTDVDIIQTVVQAGAVGIALVALYIIYKMATNHTKHIEASTDLFTKAMDRNTDAWVKNAEALARLIERLTR